MKSFPAFGCDQSNLKLIFPRFKGMNQLIELVANTDNALMAIVAENVDKAYLVLFLIIFCEVGLIVFPFLPGDGLLFAAGVIAASTEMKVTYLVILLVIAAITGNLFNYFFGRYFGLRLESSHNRIIQNYFQKYISPTQHFYQNHGGKSIILARFIPVIRTFIPFFAGVAGVRHNRFLLFTVIGSIIWVPLFTLTGFFVGEIEWVKNNFGLIFLFLVLVTLIPLSYNVLRLVVKKL
jgi:membrane-associated protein